MEAGLLGDEEPDGLGHVIHFAQPEDGRVGHEPVEGVPGQISVHVGDDGSRGDGVGRDAVLPVPLGDAAREAEYAGLGRAAFFSCV